MNQDKNISTGQTSVTPAESPVLSETSSMRTQYSQQASDDLSAALLLEQITHERKAPKVLESVMTLTSLSKKEEVPMSQTKQKDSVSKASDQKPFPDVFSLHDTDSEPSFYSRRSVQNESLVSIGEGSTHQGRASVGSEMFFDRGVGSQLFGVKSTTSELSHHFEKSKHALEDLDSNGVIKAVEDLKQKIEHLKVENEVFKRFLEESDPEAVKEMAEQAEKKRIATDRVSIMASRRDFTSRSKGSVVSLSSSGRPRASMGSIASLGQRRASTLSYTSNQRLSTGGRAPGQSIASLTNFGLDFIKKQEKEAPKINAAQKLDLVMKYMEEFDKNVENARNHANVARRQLLAKMEEMQERYDETQESIERFEELRNSNDQITLEKFARFIDEWLKKSRLTGDKIRLRYSSLRIQYHKAAANLSRKREIGLNVTEVDFDQLRVENARLIENIERKNHLLLELKSMTAENNLKLTQLKTYLQDKMNKKDTLLLGIKTIEKDIAKSDTDIEKLYIDLEAAREEYEKVKHTFENYSAPDVLDYIKYKANVGNAKKELKIWTRRKMLKELSLTIEIAEMKRRLNCKRVHPSWFE